MRAVFDDNDVSPAIDDDDVPTDVKLYHVG